ncbi:hypothetical protein [Myceligenerans indicum]|uniref:Uncharacterized protein n=1 Tax=Myceligenerans indicum TaxID=2593663 RepID=A0ABS1LGM0_9MICO|nr:hypothetical protein [Myceligenerans indicum]MBL0885189.1 hypothetical protein [Myceligenerans indicum]
MDQDALTRARLALRGVDPEIDLARVFAESRTRTPAADLREDSPPQAPVEIVLRGGGQEARADRSGTRIWRVLGWSAGAAAATALVVGLAVDAACPPAPDVVPGSPSATSRSGASSEAPPAGLTTGEVLSRAAKATSGTGCTVQTRSTLDGESLLRSDEAGPSTVSAPKNALDEHPLAVLQKVSVRAVFDLPMLDAADSHLDGLLMDELDGRPVLRVRITPTAPSPAGGDVTRLDLLIDPDTWLPRRAEVSAGSAQADYLVRSDFAWTGCTVPDPAVPHDAATARP